MSNPLQKDPLSLSGLAHDGYNDAFKFPNVLKLPNAKDMPVRAPMLGPQTAPNALATTPLRKPTPPQGLAMMYPQSTKRAQAPLIYTPGKNGPVINDQTVPAVTPIKSSPSVPQVNQAEQFGTYPPRLMQKLAEMSLTCHSYDMKPTIGRASSSGQDTWDELEAEYSRKPRKSLTKKAWVGPALGAGKALLSGVGRMLPRIGSFFSRVGGASARAAPAVANVADDAARFGAGAVADAAELGAKSVANPSRVNATTQAFNGFKAPPASSALKPNSAGGPGAVNGRWTSAPGAAPKPTTAPAAPAPPAAPAAPAPPAPTPAAPAPPAPPAPTPAAPAPTPAAPAAPTLLGRAGGAAMGGLGAYGALGTADYAAGLAGYDTNLARDYGGYALGAGMAAGGMNPSGLGVFAPSNMWKPGIGMGTRALGALGAAEASLGAAQGADGVVRAAGATPGKNESGPGILDYVTKPGKTFTDVFVKPQIDAELAKNPLAQAFGISTYEDMVNSPLQKYADIYNKQGAGAAISALWGNLSPEQKGMVMAGGGVAALGALLAMSGNVGAGALAGAGGLALGGLGLYAGAHNKPASPEQQFEKLVSSLDPAQQASLENLGNQDPEAVKTWFANFRQNPEQATTVLKDWLAKQQGAAPGQELAAAQGAAQQPTVIPPPANAPPPPPQAAPMN